jgi:hypothetical protein
MKHYANRCVVGICAKCAERSGRLACTWSGSGWFLLRASPAATALNRCDNLRREWSSVIISVNCHLTRALVALQGGYHQMDTLCISN